MAHKDYSTYDVLQDGVWVTDASHRIIYANHAMRRISGLEITQLIGENILEYPEETFSHILPYFFKAMDSMMPNEYECLVVTHSGHHIWQNGWLTPFANDSQYQGMICTVRETSVGRAAEEIIFNSDLVGIIRVRDSEFLWVNETFTKMFGYTQEELVRQSMRMVFPNDQSYEDIAQSACTLIQTGGTFQIECQLKRKDETLGWFSLNCRLLPTKPNEYIGILIDITQQKNVEAELQKNKRKLELALAGAGLGTWDWHLPSNTAHFDKRFCSMQGYSIDEIKIIFGNIFSFQKRVHPDDCRQMMTTLQNHLNGEILGYELEFRLLHKDGHWIWVRGSGSTVELDSDGNPLRLSGTLLEISGQKRLALEGSEMLRRIESLITDLDKRGNHAPPQANNPNQEQQSIDTLTRKQCHVLELIARGLNSAEIADRLKISVVTVATHRRNLMQKLDLHSVADLTRFAIKEKLVAG